MIPPRITMKVDSAPARVLVRSAPGVPGGGIDISGKANLAGGNTITGNQVFTNNVTVNGTFTQGAGTTFSSGAVNVTLTAASVWRAALGLGTLATQSGTFSGTSSGTNTGDQDLSGKANLIGGNELVGNQEIDGSLTISGDLVADNFSGTSSGTNTGDQDISGKANLTGGNTFTGPQIVTHDSTSGTPFRINLPVGYSGTVLSVVNSVSAVLMTLSSGADLSITSDISAGGTVTGSNLSGINTGDQTSIVGITGTTAQFAASLTDGVFKHHMRYSPLGPAEGETIESLPDVDEIHYLEPGGPLTALTWEVPAVADSIIGQIKRLRSTQNVGTISVQMDGGGGTFVGSTSFAVTAGVTYEWMCVDTTGSGTWVRSL